MSFIVKNKKIILTVLSVILVLLLLPFIQMVSQIIFEGGKLLGNLIRVYSSIC